MKKILKTVGKITTAVFATIGVGFTVLLILAQFIPDEELDFPRF